MSTVQDHRSMELETPLGKNVLLLDAFEGTEKLSELFKFELDMFSEKDSLDPKDIIGKNVTFTMDGIDGEPRYFNGFVNHFSYFGRNERMHQYYAEVVPWLWFLTQTTDCRIFQNKSVPDIIKQIFGDLGFTDYKLELKGKHEPSEYCVQYAETDFDFVSRLMEEEGIFYFFKHEQGKHTMVLGDDKGSFVDAKDKEMQFGLIPPDRELADNLGSWEHRYEFRPGKVAHTDYNFETPTTDLMTKSTSVVSVGNNSKFELYEFPGTYGKKDEGEALAKVRIQEEESGYDVVNSSSRAVTYSPGAKFKIKKHIVKSEEGKGYVITSIQHEGHGGAAYLTGEGAAGASYSNTFTCIPDTVSYRPLRKTEEPRIYGVQTAVVTGPPGEEIWPDKYGRVKVQFFWDREGKKDEKSSCWIRVSQIHAGKNWGAMDVPRIGEEVLVTFVEGDPDRPIVVGRVYNAGQMPPYDLPAHKTQSGMKSRSSPHGTPANYNEFRFEDKKGSEQILLHAEKNYDISVEHDETHTVGHDRTKTIDHDETSHIKNNRTETVDNNETITIMGNRTETVLKNETITIAQNRTEMVGIAETITVGAARTTTIGAVDTLTIGGAQILTIGAGVTVSIGGSQGTTVGGSQTQSIAKDQTEDIGGKQTISVAKESAVSIGEDGSMDIGKKFCLKAGDEITLSTGDASIVLKKDGTITIKGKDITLNGSGKINIKADSDVVVKGSKIKQN